MVIFLDLDKKYNHSQNCDMKKGNRNNHSENSHVFVSFKESNTSQEKKGLFLNSRKKKYLTKGHIRPKYKYTIKK